jgi:hypothetical protein
MKALVSETARSLHQALSRTPGLVGMVNRPSGRETIAEASAKQAAVRLDPQARADRFFEDWQSLQRQMLENRGWGSREAQEKIAARLQQMADALRGDPAVEDILSERRLELGLRPGGDERLKLGQALAWAVERGRNRGMER